jgi:hypothetical protein
VPDALHVDERDRAVFRTNADLFNSEPGATVNDCLTRFNVPCLMFDNFHLLLTIPFPAGYAEEENKTNLRIAPSASLLMTPRGHGTNGVRAA